MGVIPLVPSDFGLWPPPSSPHLYAEPAPPDLEARPATLPQLLPSSLAPGVQRQVRV